MKIKFSVLSVVMLIVMGICLSPVAMTSANGDNTSIPERYPPSTGAALLGGVGGASSPQATEYLGSTTVYGWNSQNGPYYTIWNASNSTILPNITPFAGNGFIGAGVYLHGNSYMLDTANNLYQVDGATGTLLNTIVTTAPPNDEQWSGAAVNPLNGRVYASSTNITSSSICEFNLNTGVATSCDPIAGSPAHIALSFDGNGLAFGYDIVDDTFMTIDPDTGVTSNVVALPYDANFGQGLGYDPATGLLLNTAFNNGTFQAELWTIDTSNPLAPSFIFVDVLGSVDPGGLNQVTWVGTDNYTPDVFATTTPLNGTTPSPGDMIIWNSKFTNIDSSAINATRTVYLTRAGQPDIILKNPQIISLNGGETKGVKISFTVPLSAQTGQQFNIVSEVTANNVTHTSSVTYTVP